MAGRTTSPNYPATAPNLGVGGGYDIIISRFSADGSALVGSRVFGGEKNDGVNIRPKYANPKEV